MLVGFLPALVAVVLLIACRHAGELSLRSGIVAWALYLVGFSLQLFGGSPGRSVTGLVLLVALSIYLILKLKAG